MKTGMPCWLAARLGVGSQPAVRRDAAGDPDAAGAEPSCGFERAIEQRLNDGALKAGGDVRDVGAGSIAPARPTPPPSSRARPDRAGPSRTRRRTAVFNPLKLKSTRRAMSGGRMPSAVARGALRSAWVSRAAGKS